jgi:hypothetical protein
MTSEHFIDGLVTIFTIIATVAIVAVIFSPKATTAAVVQSVGTAYGSDLAVAISPVTGQGTSPNLTYPTQSPFANF